MKTNIPWYSVWYDVEPHEHVAYITLRRIMEIGNEVNQKSSHDWTSVVEQGIQQLTKWARLNCSSLPRPVNIKGHTAMVFANLQDALLFRLTWGG